MGRIGVIGGSGLYNIEGITKVKKISLKTPFGEPSDEFTIGELAGREVVFLPRHGRGHRIPPTKINYRANIFAMKKLDVDRIISVTACGSLKDEIKPLDFVAVDQFVDRTNHSREMTFFDSGVVAHIEFSNPVCRQLRELIYESGKQLSLNMHEKGTYINMEGPAFSTFAESNIYRSWGIDVIGMTNMPEAKLAREAEICYSTIACVTDYDCWHPTHSSVTLEMIIENLSKNVDNAKKLLAGMISKIPQSRSCPCREALKYSIVTDKKAIPARTRKDLDIIIGKYL